MARPGDTAPGRWSLDETPLYDDMQSNRGRDQDPHFCHDDGSLYRRTDPSEFYAGELGQAAHPVRSRRLTTARSQNGYSANDRSVIHTVTVPGTGVRLPVRVGPAGDLLIRAAQRWHHEVEPLVVGTCWGYAERTIRGSSTELSNHASGTAVDSNAPEHPLGTQPSANFSAAQIAAIRTIVAYAGGCLRWGGDYTGRPDGMHLEVVKSEAECAAVLGRVDPVPSPVKGPAMAVMSWTLPPGEHMEETIPVPVFNDTAHAHLWMVTGWEPARIGAMYFIRDRGPGRSPQQEQWGGSGAFDLAPDDRPSWDLGPGCTSIALMYSSTHAIQCLIVYPPV